MRPWPVRANAPTPPRRFPALSWSRRIACAQLEVMGCDESDAGPGSREDLPLLQDAPRLLLRQCRWLPFIEDRSALLRRCVDALGSLPTRLVGALLELLPDIVGQSPWGPELSMPAEISRVLSAHPSLIVAALQAAAQLGESELLDEGLASRAAELLGACSGDAVAAIVRVVLEAAAARDALQSRSGGRGRKAQGRAAARGSGAQSSSSSSSSSSAGGSGGSGSRGNGNASGNASGSDPDGAAVKPEPGAPTPNDAAPISPAGEGRATGTAPDRAAAPDGAAGEAEEDDSRSHLSRALERVRTRVSLGSLSNDGAALLARTLASLATRLPQLLDAEAAHLDLLAADAAVVAAREDEDEDDSPAGGSGLELALAEPGRRSGASSAVSTAGSTPRDEGACLALAELGGLAAATTRRGAPATHGLHGGFAVLDAWIVLAGCARNGDPRRLCASLAGAAAAGCVASETLRASVVGRCGAIAPLHAGIPVAGAALLRSGRAEARAAGACWLEAAFLSAEADPSLEQVIVATVTATVAQSPGPPRDAAFAVLMSLCTARSAAVAARLWPLRGPVVALFDFAAPLQRRHARAIYDVLFRAAAAAGSSDADAPAADGAASAAASAGGRGPRPRPPRPQAAGATARPPLTATALSNAAELDLLVQKQLAHPMRPYRELGLIGAGAKLRWLAAGLADGSAGLSEASARAGPASSSSSSASSAGEDPPASSARTGGGEGGGTSEAMTAVVASMLRVAEAGPGELEAALGELRWSAGRRASTRRPGSASSAGGKSGGAAAPVDAERHDGADDATVPDGTGVDFDAMTQERDVPAVGYWEPPAEQLAAGASAMEAGQQAAMLAFHQILAVRPAAEEGPPSVEEEDEAVGLGPDAEAALGVRAVPLLGLDAEVAFAVNMGRECAVPAEDGGAASASMPLSATAGPSQREMSSRALALALGVAPAVSLLGGRGGAAGSGAGGGGGGGAGGGSAGLGGGAAGLLGDTRASRAPLLLRSIATTTATLTGGIDDVLVAPVSVIVACADPARAGVNPSGLLAPFRLAVAASGEGPAGRPEPGPSPSSPVPGRREAVPELVGDALLLAEALPMSSALVPPRTGLRADAALLCVRSLVAAAAWIRSVLREMAARLVAEADADARAHRRSKDAAAAKTTRLAAAAVRAQVACRCVQLVAVEAAARQAVQAAWAAVEAAGGAGRAGAKAPSAPAELSFAPLLELGEASLAPSACSGGEAEAADPAGEDEEESKEEEEPAAEEDAAGGAEGRSSKTAGSGARDGAGGPEAERGEEGEPVDEEGGGGRDGGETAGTEDGAAARSGAASQSSSSSAATPAAAGRATKRARPSKAAPEPAAKRPAAADAAKEAKAAAAAWLSCLAAMPALGAPAASTLLSLPAELFRQRCQPAARADALVAALARATSVPAIPAFAARPVLVHLAAAVADARPSPLLQSRAAQRLAAARRGGHACSTDEPDIGTLLRRWLPRCAAQLGAQYAACLRVPDEEGSVRAASLSAETRAALTACLAVMRAVASASAKVARSWGASASAEAIAPLAAGVATTLRRLAAALSAARRSSPAAGAGAGTGALVAEAEDGGSSSSTASAWQATAASPSSSPQGCGPAEALFPPDVAALLPSELAALCTGACRLADALSGDATHVPFLEGARDVLATRRLLLRARDSALSVR